MKKVCVIGGGASGMAAALSAAECGFSVTLLERQARLGKKLSATGNGRCNLTNTGAAPERYHGENPGFIIPILEKYPPTEILRRFNNIGLEVIEEYGGRVYPMSGQAGTVIDVLRFALENAGVQIINSCTVTGIGHSKSGFNVFTEQTAEEKTGCVKVEYNADFVIMACGGCAGAKLGGVRDGYTLMGCFGHTRTALYPSLTQLRTAPEYPKSLKGIRTPATVRIVKGNRVLAENRGEVLFTETGVSGTAVFEISRAVAGNTRLNLQLDFFPEQTEERIATDLLRRSKMWHDLPQNKLLTGTVHNRLGMMLCKYAGVSPTDTGTLSTASANAIAKACKCFSLPITGVSGFEAAQVTAGGVKTDEFRAGTLESKKCPGLFACGEVLDIDGDCGGFNLQWAWSSGLAAGRCGT